MRVLVVDDSRFTRGLIRRDLKGHHEVLEASDGLEGLDRVRIDQPDVILVDLLMPNMDGFEFLKAVRRAGFAGPVIVCSANAQSPVEEKILELGATAFIAKPELLCHGRAREIVEEARGEETVRPRATVRREAQVDDEAIIEDGMTAARVLVRSLLRLEDGTMPVTLPDETASPEDDLGASLTLRLSLGDDLTAATRLPLGDLDRRPLPHTEEAPQLEDRETGDPLVTAFLNTFARVSARRVVPKGQATGAAAEEVFGGRAGERVAVSGQFTVLGVADGEVRLTTDPRCAEILRSRLARRLVHRAES